MTFPFTYNGNLPWLESRTILLVRHGSHAYGTSTPTSDVDYKGIAVPPAEYFYGFLNVFEQADKFPDVDAVIYDIRKFFKLASDCNPNIIEVLFGAEEEIVPRHGCNLAEYLGQQLLEERDLFLSQKARHTFSGYAHAQLKRIRGHHTMMKDPPTAPPTRGEFGLPESGLVNKEVRDAAFARITKQLDDWEIDLTGMDPAGRIALVNRLAEKFEATDVWRVAGRVAGFGEDFLGALDAERRFRAAQTRWTQYREWVENRNAKRSELEAKYGYDTKHAMHLVRLLRMAHEILGEGKVVVKRPDAEELLAIRNGAWSYDRLVEYANDMDARLEAVAARSKLPKTPDRKAIDRLCVEIVEGML